jgi:hypothetical protein
MSKHRKKSTPRLKIGGGWVAHKAALIRLLRGLSLSARPILDTLELEHCRRGGRENGRLVCTYSDFEAGGTQRSRISSGLRKLEDARVIKVQRGRRAYADMRIPSIYTLTLLSTYQTARRWSPPMIGNKKPDWNPPLAPPKAGPESTTTRGSKPDRNPPLLSRSTREDGWGWRGGLIWLVRPTPQPPQRGRGLVPRPPFSPHPPAGGCSEHGR